jgi:hypothetical protein
MQYDVQAPEDQQGLEPTQIGFKKLCSRSKPVHRFAQEANQSIEYNIKKKNLYDLIREDFEIIKTKKYGKITKHKIYRLLFPKVVEPDRHAEVRAYAAKIAPNIVDKDELTLAQAQRPEMEAGWPLWLKPTRHI